MPCNCDHMEPTEAERHRKQAARLLRFVLQQLGRDVPSDLAYASEHIYGEGYGDAAVKELCSTLRGLGEDTRLSVIYGQRTDSSPTKKVARELMDWWEEHQEVDRKREKKEAEQKEGRRNQYEKLKKEFENE